MAVTTALVVGSAVVGAVGSNMAAKKSADATKSATNATIAEQQRQFDLVRQDTAGQRALGNNAVDALSKLYGYGPPAVSAPVTSAPKTDPRFAGLGSAQAAIAGRVLGRSPMTIDNATQEPVAQLPATASRSGPDMSVFFESPDYQFNLAEGQKAIDRSAAARGGLLSGSAVKEGMRYGSGLASREYSSFVDRLMQQAGLGNTGIGASAAAGANAANNISAANMNGANARSSIYQNNAANVNNAVQGAASNYMLMRYLGSGGPTGTPGYGGPIASNGGLFNA